MFIISVLPVLWLVFPTIDCQIHRFGPSTGFMCHCKNNEQCNFNTGECFSGCASFWYGPGCQYRDIAEGEYSRHSDNLNPPYEKYSNLANDGDPETCSSTAEVNSAAKKTNPFWRVWLPTTERISELMILTKVENLDHFKGFKVYVENVTEDQREGNNHIPPDRQTCYNNVGETTKNATITVLCDNPIVGNQVRIELKVYQSQLVLCDVRINGGRNLAFGRNISQAEPQGISYQAASNAVDGQDKQSDWTECSFIGDVKDPWLKLDMGRSTLIWYIRILAHRDNYREALRLQLDTHITNIMNETANLSVERKSNVSLNTVARYVTITKPGERKRLQICELKVFGDCLEDECGLDCSKTCHCKNTNIWDKMAGKCTLRCAEGWTGESCDQRSGIENQQSCGHCLNSNECDTFTGECRTGCQDGYYPPDCKRECDDGKYGGNCSFTCSQHCKNGDICKKTDGHCERGCKRGYTGSNCARCPSGKYGQNCVSKCPSNCNGGLCDNVDGKCQRGCTPGLVGEKCEQKCDEGNYGQNCLLTCPSNCYDGLCDNIDGKCQRGCKSGYSGEKCKQKCQSGRYGQDCKHTCLSSCNDGVCDSVDGKCQSGCKPGYFGEKCENNCPFGQYGQNCTKKCSDNCHIDGSCYKVDGRCVYGCKPGYSDVKCEQKCQSGRYGHNCRYTCPSNCNKGECDGVDGKCQSGCKPGYTGEKCKNNCRFGQYGQNCTKQCSSNCRYDGSCNNVDGSCVHGCKPGYSDRKDRKCEQKCESRRYGQDCLYTCPSSCNDGVCDNVDGKCQSGCKPGYIGEKCENNCRFGQYGQNCTKQCSSNCRYDGSCNNVDGSCVHGCKPGYSDRKDRKCEQKCESRRYGQDCLYTCPSSCNDGVCDNVDGKCQSGCKPGYIGEKCENNCRFGQYGQNCTKQCSSNCRYDGSCNNVDGSCVHGCKPGYSDRKDRKCEQKCESRRYGQDCLYTCPSSCNDGVCDNVDGKCQSGCKPGYIGEKCENNCRFGQYGQNCTKQCSSNCRYDGSCNNVDGSCVHGCKPGYSDRKDRKCEQKCESRRYGQDCLYTCPSSCNDGVCDNVDGKCQSGCKPGYIGEKCENKCHKGKYGQNCTKKCSDNCKYGKCDNVDGRCVHGCKSGYSDEKCEQKCESGRYGQNCQNTCPSSCNDGVCDSVDGKCKYGCKPGYIGEKCKNKCHNGKYGQNCTETCSDNCNNGTCNNVDGRCMHGCKPGFLDGKCEQACPNGKYGQNCTNSCSESCTYGQCDNVNGNCIDGCKPGYIGNKCEQDCDDGFYGTNCSMECGYCRNTTSCDKVSGFCIEGCVIGYQGDNCLQALEKFEPTSAGSTIGVVVALCILLIVAVVVILVVIYKRRNLPQRTEEQRGSLGNGEVHNTTERSSATGYQEASGTTEQTTGELTVYANTIPMDIKQTSKSKISISALVEHVKGNGRQILEEFKALPVGMIYPSAIGMKPCNRGKNRYKDMKAYDHSRVILTKCPGIHGSDYINASFIKGYAKEQAYIAAQGPIENTINDFWRMIWEKNVYTIVMLTNLIEEEKKKCLQYWPSEESTIRYYDYNVCLLSEAIYAEFTIRNLTVSFKGNPPRNICQFHFKAWPDKGLPRSPSSLLQFWRKVRNTSKQRPWLVHCSAGVGRTGTFIATDILFDQVKAEGCVDVFTCVKDLRDQRTNMVQTKDQYKFLFVLMIECFVLPSEPVSLENIHRVMNDLTTVGSTSRKTKLLLQYEALNEDMSYLTTFDESEDKYSAAKLVDNKNKNRFSDVIPQNEFRPFLITNIPNCTNYINAVFMPSYCETNSFILTQIPLENTAIDCCRLVYEQDVKVLVTFGDAVKGKVGIYLPERDSITVGPFIVVKTSEEENEFCKKRTYHLSYKSEEKAITELVFKAWSKGLTVPKDPVTMLNFIQEVENHKRASGNKPVIVQCLNGAEKSGLIAVLVNILERAKLEEEVSIPQVIRQLRVRREQIIPNFEQFKFCHDMLLHYVERDTTYANM